jgi:glycosyltransferase involved in cell wall biosynthesis
MISIIIPAFNAEKTIAVTIESCLKQTFKDYEIIVVNDQSTDKTQAVLDLYPNINVIQSKDYNEKGIVAALNRGISEAKGEYIARLDADDFMDPRRLEFQMAEFEKNPELLLCSTDAYIVDEDGKQLGGSLRSTDDLEELDYKCCIIHPSVMFKKDFFVNNFLFYDPEFEYAEDYDLWIRFRNLVSHQYGTHYRHIPLPLLNYRVSGKDRLSAIHGKEQKDKSKLIRAKYDIKPYLSVINLGSYDKLEEELSKTDINYEIIVPDMKPQGKYVAFSGYENSPKRFDIQIQALNANPQFVGCGTYIDIGKSSFFYTPDPDVIENELLNGRIAIERNTFLFRNLVPNCGNLPYFDLLLGLLPFGQFTNISQPLVKIEDYKGVQNSDFTNRIKKAKKAYIDIINVVQVNITSDGNFSGVDRYLKTLEDNYPPNVRCKRITFRASPDKLSVDLSNRDHVLVYYNAGKTQLEHLYDMIWDNLSYMFQNKRNLIVQSNCFNLYTFLTWLRRKVAFKHICMLHCVPYREIIRSSRDEFAKKEAEFLDETKEFKETPWHYDAVNLADHAIVNTSDSEYYYNRVGYSAPYTLINNGVEKIGKGNRVKKDGEPFRFIFVGHSNPLKGFGQILSIIAEVNKQYPIEVHWAGSSDPNMAKEIRDNNLPIKIYGVLPTEKLYDLYRNVDAALVATAVETCAYSCLEALSAELPIIATRAHGVTEIVENVGLLVNMNIRAEIDKEMYKQAMIRVITDETTRKEMSIRSARKYHEYSKEKLLKETIELYRDLLK